MVIINPAIKGRIHWILHALNQCAPLELLQGPSSGPHQCSHWALWAQAGRSSGHLWAARAAQGAAAKTVLASPRSGYLQLTMAV